MKKKILAAGMLAIAISTVNVSGITVFASGETSVTSEATANEKESKEDGKAKMEAAIKKWDALSPEKKAEVYKIYEEKQTVYAKMLDKLVSLGVMDAKDVTQMKADMKDRLTKVKESGKLPLRRCKKCPKPTGSPYNKDFNNKQQ